MKKSCIFFYREYFMFRAVENIGGKKLKKSVTTVLETKWRRHNNRLNLYFIQGLFNPLYNLFNPFKILLAERSWKNRLISILKSNPVVKTKMSSIIERWPSVLIKRLLDNIQSLLKFCVHLMWINEDNLSSVKNNNLRHQEGCEKYKYRVCSLWQQTNLFQKILVMHHLL